MRIVFVQFGNYADAVQRFAAGGLEDFYGQRYCVDFQAGLTKLAEEVTVVHLSREDPEQRLSNGVRSVGLQLYGKGKGGRHVELLRLLHRLRPDHMVLVTPQPLVLAWALATGVRTLPIFADSFESSRLKARLTAGLMARLLNAKRIEWVSNHNLAASRSLVRIGVAATKVLPFDWPILMTPAERPAKSLNGSDAFSVIYAGQVSESKGVGDAIDAVALLNRKGGKRWSLTVVGGLDEGLARRAQESGFGDRIEFKGRIPHDQIVPLMNRHDAVVIPSRHEYSEGLPMTIYEGLCSRTPLVASDHPMFTLKLRHEENALIFPAKDPAALAACFERLSSDAGIYDQLSRAADEAAAAYFCPLKYDALIMHWLKGTPEDQRELATFSMASHRYDQQLGALPT